MLDEESCIFEVLFLHGEHDRICGGYKREGGCALPGEACRWAVVLPASRGGGINRQESAEGVVARVDRVKA